MGGIYQLQWFVRTLQTIIPVKQHMCQQNLLVLNAKVAASALVIPDKKRIASFYSQVWYKVFMHLLIQLRFTQKAV